MLREHVHVKISTSALSYEENNIVKGKKKHNLTILVFPSFKCFLAFSKSCISHNWPSRKLENFNEELCSE